MTRRWVSTKRNKHPKCASSQWYNRVQYSTIWWAYQNRYILLIKHVHDNVSIPLQKCDNYSFSVLKYFRNPEFGGDVNILCGPKMMDFYKTILLSFVIMKKAILLVEPITPKNSPRGTVTCKWRNWRLF